MDPWHVLFLIGAAAVVIVVFSLAFLLGAMWATRGKR